jgi:glycosyltransferase involved in cell wall biosynthesis
LAKPIAATTVELGPMKVLVISSQYPPIVSPESQHTVLLCENLAMRGVEVHLLTSALHRDAPKPNGYTLHAEIPAWSWAGARQLIRSTRRIQPDAILLIYLSWIYSDQPMITFAPRLLRLAGCDAGCVTQFESTTGSPVTPTFNAQLKWQIARCLALGRTHGLKYGTLLESSAQLIALSQRHADELVAASASVAKKITVIPAPPLLRTPDGENGDTRARGRALLGLESDDDTVVLIFFGYIYAGKGVDRLLEAAALLRQRGRTKFKLVIAGKIDPAIAAPLHDQERALDLAGSVLWLGFTADEVSTAYLQASDIAVLPFDQGVRLNNSSFAVCAAHGLPVITTQSKDTESPFQHLKNVFFCPPKQASAIADAVERLSFAPELRRELREGAMTLAGATFSWDNVIASTVSVLQTAAAQKKSGRP